MNIETNRDTEDAFALISIIKLAEKDVENGEVRKADDIFKDLWEKMTENGKKVRALI